MLETFNSEQTVVRSGNVIVELCHEDADQANHQWRFRVYTAHEPDSDSLQVGALLGDRSYGTGHVASEDAATQRALLKYVVRTVLDDTVGTLEIDVVDGAVVTNIVGSQLERTEKYFSRNLLPFRNALQPPPSADLQRLERAVCGVVLSRVGRPFLPEYSSWGMGGCGVLARALLELRTDATLYGITGRIDEPGSNPYHHLVVGFSDWFLDARGLQTKRDLLTYMDYFNGIGRPKVVPLAPEELLVPCFRDDIITDEKLSTGLARAIRTRLDGIDKKIRVRRPLLGVTVP